MIGSTRQGPAPEGSTLSISDEEASDLPASVLHALHAEITSGRWALGSRIPSWTELCAERNVGRSTVREAVSTLVHLGMLRPNRGQGTRVTARSAIPGLLTNLTAHYRLNDLLRAQRSVEVEICRLAALHSDSDDLETLARAHQQASLRDCRHPLSGRFHSALLEAAKSPLLTDMAEGIEARLRNSDCPERLIHGDTVHAFQHHRAILAAITAGDGDQAATAAAAHARGAMVSAADLSTAHA